MKKVTIEIRLINEINEDELKDIALKLKKERSYYKMLWIFYYLPENEIGNGAWATTHFKPELDVKILGASKEASESMNKFKVAGDIVSSWKYNDAILPNKIYLVKENGKLYIKTI